MAIKNGILLRSGTATRPVCVAVLFFEGRDEHLRIELPMRVCEDFVLPLPEEKR